MGAVLTGITAPIGQLQVRIQEVIIIKPAGVIFIDVFSQHGKAFIDPGFFVAVLVPVNHVLKFVSHSAVDVVFPKPDRVGIYKEHFVRVGIGCARGCTSSAEEK